MSNPIARSSEEIRDVLAALEGEHLPSRKSYITSAFFVVVCGIFFPLLLAGLLFFRGVPIDLVRDYEALSTIVFGPLIAFGLLQTSMARYVVDDSHVGCIAPLGIGSWTMMRAEIERIEASVGTTGMSIVFYSSLQKTRTMPLRKRYRDAFLREYPELRREKVRAVIAERKRQQKNKLVLILLAVVLVAVIVTFTAWVLIR